MSITRTQRLQAEMGMLKEMLRKISPGRVIERSGLEGRISNLQAEIDASLPREAQRLDLTFSGEPVEGSRSIVADFAGRALAIFCEAVATIAASRETNLGDTGRLPDVAMPLRILGPALGSFGFELEVPVPPPPPLLRLLHSNTSTAEADNPTLLAVEETLALIAAAQRDDDEEVSELLSEMHTRAATKVRDFVKLIVDRRAAFAARLGERRVTIASIEAGRRAIDALNIEVVANDIPVNGRLWVLPASRQFELHSDTGFFKGKVERWSVSPADLPNGGATVQAVLRETRVGEKKPHYTLLRAVVSR